MIYDIHILVLTYAAEPIYKLPKWVDKKFYPEILSRSLNNPRASRALISYISSYIKTNGKYPDWVSYELFTNPSDSMLKFLSTSQIGLSSDYFAFNTNPMAIQLRKRNTQFTRPFMIKNICQYCPHINYILEYCTEIDKKSLSLNSSPEVVEYLLKNIHLLDTRNMWENPGLIEYLISVYKTSPYQVCYRKLSLNPHPKAKEILEKNPYLIYWHNYYANPNSWDIMELRLKEPYNFDGQPPTVLADIASNPNPKVMDYIETNLDKLDYTEDNSGDVILYYKNRNVCNILTLASNNHYLFKDIYKARYPRVLSLIKWSKIENIIGWLDTF